VARVVGGSDTGTAGNGTVTPVSSLEEDDELTKEQFKAVLAQVDKGLRALPATAQVKTMCRRGKCCSVLLCSCCTCVMAWKQYPYNMPCSLMT
jgi:hypothetical protein